MRLFFCRALYLYGLTHNGATWVSPREMRNLRTYSSCDGGENSMSLTGIWERALLQQRAGNTVSAMREYNLFLAAAAECNVPAASLAEVHVNMGQLMCRMGDSASAREHFISACEHRSLATAHVNLVLLTLADGSNDKLPGKIEHTVLNEAKKHAEAALVADERDDRSVEVALKIIKDISRVHPP